MTEEHFAEQERWVVLSQVSGLGNDAYRKLLAAFGEPRQIFAAGFGPLKNVVGADLARRILETAENEVDEQTALWLRSPGNHLLTLADRDYPQSLLHISDPPPLLYLKGRRELLNRAAIAVVGSRNGSVQGVRDAQAFASVLSSKGLCVISGLALGIDAAAHKGGLENIGSSIAVVGTGLDIVYPARNRPLAHQLASEGALLSEFPLGTPARAHHFPRRNRLISGLARGCLVVEAALHSGSLITARLAADQGKEVFAIPGSIHSPLAKGCHLLIKEGAKLVEAAADILQELGIANDEKEVPLAALLQAGGACAPEEAQLLAAMDFHGTDVDTLAARSGLTADRICAMLLTLELEGRVAALPGGLYQKIA